MINVCSAFSLRYLAGLITVGLCMGCATTKYVTPSEINPTAPSGTTAAVSTGQGTSSNERILGTGDTVDIEVYRHEDLKKSLRIDENGKINFPLVGDVEVAGLNAFQLRSKLQEALSKYVVDPQVIVSVKGMHGQKVYVLGEVAKPGVFDLDTPMSVLEAISNAGGFTLDAKNETVVVVRGRTKPQLVKLDLESALKRGDISQDIQLKGGDIVFVPPTFIADASRFSVYITKILSPILMIEQGIVLGDEVNSIFEGKQNQRQTNINIFSPQ